MDTPAQADINVVIDDGQTVPGRHGASGSTSVTFAGNEINAANVEIAAGGATPNELQEIAAHEFGHALGIDGHSDSPDDLMAPVEIRACDAYGSPLPVPAHPVTERDLNTLKACYPALFAAPARHSPVSQQGDRDAEAISLANGLH